MKGTCKQEGAPEQAGQAQQLEAARQAHKVALQPAVGPRLQHEEQIEGDDREHVDDGPAAEVSEDTLAATQLQAPDAGLFVKRKEPCTR